MSKVIFQIIPAVIIESFKKFLNPGIQRQIGYFFYGQVYTFVYVCFKQPHIPLRSSVPQRRPVYRH